MKEHWWENVCDSFKKGKTKFFFVHAVHSKKETTQNDDNWNLHNSASTNEHIRKKNDDYNDNFMRIEDNNFWSFLNEIPTRYTVSTRVKWDFVFFFIVMTKKRGSKSKVFANKTYYYLIQKLYIKIPNILHRLQLYQFLYKSQLNLKHILSIVTWALSNIINATPRL